MQTQNAYFISEWLAFAISGVSLCCTLVTLLIIKLMKKKSGYVFLISMMTMYQLIFDLNYIFWPIPSYETCIMWNFFYFFGGLGNAFTSNVITYTMIYVISNIRSFNIYDNITYVLSFTVLLPLIIGILACVVIHPQSQDDDLPYQFCIFNESTLAKVINYFFYWSRIVSIVYNFIAFLYISYEMNRLTARTKKAAEQNNTVISTNTSTMNRTTMTTSQRGDKQVDAIFVLAMRLKYYPLAQSLCIIGSAWDEFLDYRYNSDASMFAASITAPLSGVLYFMIFLYMQPNARNTIADYMGTILPRSSLYSVYSPNRPTNTSTPHNTMTDFEQSRSMNFRNSISNIDETDLEAIINQSMLEQSPDGTGLPLQWTSNPVRQTSNDLHSTPATSTGGSIAMMYRVAEEEEQGQNL